MFRRHFGWVAAFALSIAFGGVVGLAPAAQAQSTCNSADFTVDGQFDINGYLACLSGTNSTPSAARPGESIVTVLSGFTPGETVKLVIEAVADSTAAGDGSKANPYIAKADASGTIRVSVTMPTAVGTYRIVATGSNSAFSTVANVVVSLSGSSPGSPGGAPGGTPGSGSGLPTTGSNSLRTLAIGMGLVVLGAGAVVGSIRRRTIARV
jgi:hypothetical protein